MKNIQVSEAHSHINSSNFDSDDSDEMSNYLRRKSYFLQVRRWRKLNREMSKSMFLVNRPKHRGGMI
jgi:hypothetical protein